ncbi:MAG TPA: glycoside hydrolase family 3 N-terminal domain-containing protein [Micromonospora sp.]|nr:glycoside hydrolase family 3 N-terminal domain-containing protein [Micromonospora sp.]
MKSQAEIGAANSPATTRTWAEGMVESLTSIGVNLNYAPVVDMNVNPSSPAIGMLQRSFSDRADVVVRNSTIEIEVHREADVKTSLKHSPGSGSATGNTDFNGPVVSDDMQAVAISSRYGRDEAVAMALEAGLDLLVFANQQTYDPRIVDETIDNIVNLVRTGRLTEERIDQSVARVDTLRPPC